MTEHPDACITTENLSVFYGATQAIKNVSLALKPHAITAFIGPSGCGKSTLLRTFNRLNDTITGCMTAGTVRLNHQDIFAPAVDVTTLRRHVGMVFQKPNPFPKSIYNNIAYGLKIHGLAADRADRDQRVEQALTMAGLWDEVKDRLQASALSLSGGQQQRLCIARALAVEPAVLLLDEPCSALDPVSTSRIEDLLLHLKTTVTIIIVTHNMAQARRIADDVAFFDAGTVVEFNQKEKIFAHPQDQRTARYVGGQYG